MKHTGAEIFILNASFHIFRLSFTDSNFKQVIDIKMVMNHFSEKVEVNRLESVSCHSLWLRLCAWWQHGELPLIRLLEVMRRYLYEINVVFAYVRV
jgi:hypothetical protein